MTTTKSKSAATTEESNTPLGFMGDRVYYWPAPSDTRQKPQAAILMDDASGQNGIVNIWPIGWRNPVTGVHHVSSDVIKTNNYVRQRTGVWSKDRLDLNGK